MLSGVAFHFRRYSRSAGTSPGDKLFDPIPLDSIGRFGYRRWWDNPYGFEYSQYVFSNSDKAEGQGYKDGFKDRPRRWQEN